MKGGGYESCGPDANYTNCKIKFADIDNIHAVRSCFEKMYALAFSIDKVPDTQSWMAQVDQTGYLQMLQMILIGANDVMAAMTTQYFENVVVHCSDGWDRTSQIASLA